MNITNNVNSFLDTLSDITVCILLYVYYIFLVPLKNLTNVNLYNVLYQ